MKKTALLFTILLAIGVMATTACDPTSLSLDGTRQVKFTATSHESPMTKTSYGGYTTDGKYQTISWNDGDKVRIWSPAGGSISGTPVPSGLDVEYVYADYKLKDAADDTQNHLSKAHLDNVDPNGLVWSGSDNAIFYAAYPGEKVKVGTNTSGQLVFAFPLLPAQSGTAAGVKDMPLLSKETVRNGQTVTLNFYPAFNAIEFHMMSDSRYNPNNESFTVDWVKLSKESESFDPLTATLCYYDINGTSPVVSSLDGKGYEIKLENLNATVDNDHEAKFMFFTLPYDHTGLVLTVHSKKTADGVTEESTRTLKLQQNGEWVKFPVGHKAVIKGMPYNPDGLWCFSTITLTGQVLNWVTDGNSIETNSSKSPQASQFAVKGVTESTSARQTWILPTATTTATVSFKIMSPFGGTYEVTPHVNSYKDDFDVVFYDEEGNEIGSTGTIGWTDENGKNHPTKVIFTVTPKASAIGTSKKIWFNTTVKDTDGNVYNIDSETQLYDMRGYHYFMTQEP